MPHRPQEEGVPEQPAVPSLLPDALEAANVENSFERRWEPHRGQGVPFQSAERTSTSESAPQASQ